MFASTTKEGKCILVCEMRVNGEKKRKAVVSFYAAKDGVEFSTAGHALATRIRSQPGGMTWGEAVALGKAERDRLRAA